jgi:hypothetical protein
VTGWVSLGPTLMEYKESRASLKSGREGRMEEGLGNVVGPVVLEPAVAIRMMTRRGVFGTTGPKVWVT